MKETNLLKGAFAVLLLSSPLVGAETKYPAADFKPTVQYQDAEYIAKSQGSAATGRQGQATAPDAQYPATAFQPKVLYQDTEYKHSAPKPAAPKSSAAERTSVEKPTGAAEATENKAESKTNYLIALVVLGLVGFVFFRKRTAPAPVRRQAPVYSAETTSGLTGVDKYLQRKEGPVATGVARYLEKQVATVKEKAAATGVAKYLEKKVIESETGVAKYLRNKG